MDSCSIDGCANPAIARSFCRMHYARWRRTGSTDGKVRRRCTVEGCDGWHVARGLCERHYRNSRTPGQKARHYGERRQRTRIEGRTCRVCDTALSPFARSDAAYCSQACKNYVVRLRRDYGLTLEWYREQLARQGGKCAVCHAEPPLHVDHDHKTGRERGLLCLACNVTLGNVRDDPMLLHALADYLLDYA